LVDDFVLVSEEQLCTAIQLLVEKAHTIAEGAGAAPLAAAIKLKDEFKGKKVALVITGGNITFQNLCKVIL
jgi:threonine dehydratase